MTDKMNRQESLSFPLRRNFCQQIGLKAPPSEPLMPVYSFAGSAVEGDVGIDLELDGDEGGDDDEPRDYNERPFSPLFL